MSSSGDPQTGGGGEEERAEEAAAMDTTEATTTWDVARQTSSVMVTMSFVDDLENKAAKQLEVIQQLRERVETAESQSASSQQTTEQLEKRLLQERETNNELEKKVRETSKETDILTESIETVKERADRSAVESDQLREEISRLTKSNQSYQKQLAELEAQAKLDGSSLFPLQFKNQRLDTENDNLRTHSNWLEGELRNKTEELARLKSSTAQNTAQTLSNMDAANTERDELAIEAKQLRQQLERVQTKSDGLSRELLDAKQEVSDIRLESEQEVTGSRRLVDLRKEELLRIQQQYDGLATQLDSMKAMAIEAESEDDARWKEREQELKEVSKGIMKEQSDRYEKRIEFIQKDLDNYRERCKQAEDGLLLIKGPAANDALPRKALPSSQGNDDERGESISVTELYGRVAQAEDAFNAETLLRKKAEIRVARIEKEIQANAPLLVRQRRQYELVLQTQRELQSRYEDSLDEAVASRNECNILQSEVVRLGNENKVLTEDGKELAKQVQDMLVARSSGEDDPNVVLTVAQMQSANQRLLKEYREMTTKVKDLEAKLQQEDLHQEIQDYKAEITSLEEERNRQEPLVEKIVQQRDLYRALLNKQDTNLLGGGDESSAVAVVKGQSKRAKILQEEHNKLTKELCEAKARLDVMERDKAEASDRMMRYEMLNDELTKSIDKTNLNISKGQAAVARSEAESAFYKDKAKMLEEAQQRTREEIKNVTASKNRIMLLNTNLEQSIFKANNECSRMGDELRQAKSKLLLAEAEAGSAKAAEKRIVEESNQLRNELSRQGAVLDGVQRIESSLLLKNNTDIEGYKLEIAMLKEKLTSIEKKQETALDDLKEKISDSELQLKELEASRANASKEALDAKKESLVAIKKADVASKKSTHLERQLNIAKKKLGETDGDMKDVELELRAQLESLCVDLEGSKKETDTWKTRSATYEKLAKDNEAAVSAITEASGATTKLLDENIVKLQKELEHSNVEMSKRKEVITELTNDLSAQREERDKAVNIVKQQISGFKADAEKHQLKAEEVEIRFNLLQKDVRVLQSDLIDAQTNYERELALHAAARTDVRTAREDCDKANRLRDSAMEEAATLQNKFKIQESSVEAEKSKLEKTEADFEKKIEASRAENTLLHTQLEKINDQIEKMQSRSIGESLGDGSKLQDSSGDEEILKLRMSVSELRELVKFVRAEKDVIQGQLDTARRSTERERIKTSVARRAVEEREAELQTLQESYERKYNVDSEGETSMADKLKATEEQSRLLSDSNAHLQNQVQDLQNSLASNQNELEASKNALKPAVTAQQQLEIDKASLLAEKESLLREINDWKGRVHSLVSKFNQVDPEEHSKLLTKSEDLEKQIKSLEDKESSAQDETKRIRTLASRASTQLSQNKQMVENQKKTIAKLTMEKNALVKSQKESTSKKDLDELKEKMLKLEKQREAETIQLKGSAEMNEKLRERLRQFQKAILDLRKGKESLSKQLAEARSIAEKKKLEVVKAAATQKQKESALASNAATSPPVAPIESTTTNTGGKVKPVAPISKPTPVSTATSTVAQATIEKKEEKQVMPKVPPGGFKFAASKTPAVSAESTMAKKTNSTESGKKGVGIEPGTGKQSSDEKTGDSKKEKDPPSPKRPPAPSRRNSGEVKEMSLKDKLLEKKRKLMEMKKAMEAKQEESNVPEPVSIEPDAKRNKTENKIQKKVAETAVLKPKPPALDAKAAAFVPKVSALKEAASAMAAKSASPKADSTNNDVEIKEGEEKPSTGQTPALDGGGSAIGSIFGGGTKAPTSFGTGFGTGSISTFGKPSGFGSVGTGFGSAGSAPGKSTFGFGGAKSEAGSSSPSTATSSAFGGAAFLNIKPPGNSSGTAPQFSFGKSGSITLPTPGVAATNPKPSIFNAFSSPPASQAFGGQVSAKPLFGNSSSASNEKKEKEEIEDGEMPDK